jgi:hypothetical protein
MFARRARHTLYSIKEKVLSPSLNYQRSLVSVLLSKKKKFGISPNPENWVSVPELSKPSILSPSLVLMMVFDDVAERPTC